MFAWRSGCCAARCAATTSHDLHAELANLSLHQLGLAVLFTVCSFLALIGYEYSALGLVGKRMPLPHLALASFATQSIAHSTGFAFVIGASLRYHFYSDRGLGIGDVAMVQMFFTATFTLGVATLAGGVVLVEPMRLAMATGLPPLALAGWLPATALSLVIAYVVWGGFFHRPLRWRGHELVLPSAGATLVQIFFGVADLMAVAAALYVLLPAELGLGYRRGAGRVHGLDRDRPDQPCPGQPRRVRVRRSSCCFSRPRRRPCR